MSSSLLHSRLPLRLTALQEHPVVLLLMLPCELPEATASVATGISTGGLIWFIIEMDQPQSFGDFDHGPETSHGRTPKLTCPSPTTGARGLPRFHAGDEVHDMRETLFVRSPNWKKHKLCLLPFHTPISTPRRNRKERQAYSLLQTTMEPLPHGL